MFSKMAAYSQEDKILFVLLGLIESLSMSVEEFEKIIAKPAFLDPDKPNKRYRYEDPDAETLQVLMCVRVASGLQAAAILLVNHHTTEVAVLFRTIDDFLSDIVFVDEVIEKGIGQATTAQRQFLERYFFDDKRNAEELLETRVKINHNERRQKVQASEARMYGGENPDRTKKIVQAIDDAFSGVVHGNYSSAMEMYGRDDGEKAHFHTRGLPARYVEYRHHLGLYIHRALNMFFKAAVNLGHHELASVLRDARQSFEKSAAYTSH